MALRKMVWLTLSLGSALAHFHEPNDLGPGASQFFASASASGTPTANVRPPTPPNVVVQVPFAPPPLPAPVPASPSSSSSTVNPAPATSTPTVFPQPPPGPRFDGSAMSSSPPVRSAPATSFFERPVPFSVDPAKPFPGEAQAVLIVESSPDLRLRPASPSPPPAIVPFPHNRESAGPPVSVSYAWAEPTLLEEVDGQEEHRTFYY